MNIYTVTFVDFVRVPLNSATGTDGQTDGQTDRQTDRQTVVVHVIRFSAHG